MSEETSNEQRLTHRRLAIPQVLWTKILKLAEAIGVGHEDLVIRLLKDGYLARTWEAARFEAKPYLSRPRVSSRPLSSPLTKVMIEVEGKPAGSLELAQVPAAGETVTWRGVVYTVQERAWALSPVPEGAGTASTAFLRLAPWR